MSFYVLAGKEIKFLPHGDTDGKKESKEKPSKKEGSVLEDQPLVSYFSKKLEITMIFGSGILAQSFMKDIQAEVDSYMTKKR
jgi:hypothetical protein